ncbi:MAG TPA: JAB domain-containing protein [Sphingomicrobium sp.]|nr:JAB domain-containing protein [Sphingomicrobium sp.]
MRYQRAESPALLNGHEAARRFFASCFVGADHSRERLWVAHVDEGARCIHVEHYEGDPSSVGVPVRDIVADAARLGSAGLVLAHNHPGGDSTPSNADCRATRRLAVAGESLDVALLDHLIFAGDDCTSMRRLGLL